MGLGYWLITRTGNTIISEDNLESYTIEHRDMFMCDMKEREAILSALPENDYNQVKIETTTNKVWEALETIYDGDKHSKIVKLQNWTCLFQEAKMMEDESISVYASRVSEIFVEIKGCGGKKEDDEIIWMILKTLTPPFK